MKAIFNLHVYKKKIEKIIILLTFNFKIDYVFYCVLSDNIGHSELVGNTLTSQLASSGFNSQKQLKCEMAVLFWCPIVYSAEW